MWMPILHYSNISEKLRQTFPMETQQTFLKAFRIIQKKISFGDIHRKTKDQTTIKNLQHKLVSPKHDQKLAASALVVFNGSLTVKQLWHTFHNLLKTSQRLFFIRIAVAKHLVFDVCSVMASILAMRISQWAIWDYSWDKYRCRLRGDNVEANKKNQQLTLLMEMRFSSRFFLLTWEN